MTSNESNKSPELSHEQSYESNKSFHSTRSTDTNTHLAHNSPDQDEISDNGSTNTNYMVSNKNIFKLRVMQHPGLPLVVQSTHNKFGENYGFKETTYKRCLFISGSFKTTTRQNLSDLYISCLFLNGLQNFDSIEDLSSYVNVAKAITAYNNLDATLTTPKYSVKKGLCIFGGSVTKAVLKEIQKLHQIGVISEIDPNNMTVEQRNRALVYMMYLKQKRNSDIKGPDYVDSRGQQGFSSKEEKSAPTILLYASIITWMIDAAEVRFVATADIPGAFLQTNQPDNEEVILRITRTMAEILAKLDTKVYCSKMIDQNGKKILYAKAQKVIYGKLCDAILFWTNITEQLDGPEVTGFVTNP